MGHATNNNTPVSPETDTFSHERLNEMLASSLASSRGTAATGLNSAERHVTALPEGLSRGDDGCEVIPGQNLKIFGRTTNGIKVFSSVKNGEEDSEAFLRGNIQTIKSFASVLETLCEVYQLNMQCVAIYHESCGNTIAFNSNKALYFNLRLFAHLHFNDGGPLSSECYSYWFTTMAHELAVRTDRCPAIHNYFAPRLAIVIHFHLVSHNIAVPCLSCSTTWSRHTTRTMATTPSHTSLFSSQPFRPS